MYALPGKEKLSVTVLLDISLLVLFQMVSAIPNTCLVFWQWFISFLLWQTLDQSYCFIMDSDGLLKNLFGLKKQELTAGSYKDP